MTMLSDEQRKSKLLYVEIIFKTVENPTEVIHKLKNLYVWRYVTALPPGYAVCTAYVCI